MQKGPPSDKQLDGLERMLERYIEENKASRRKSRALTDPFYQKLKILTESQKRVDEILLRAQSRPEDAQPKH